MLNLSNFFQIRIIFLPRFATPFVKEVLREFNLLSVIPIIGIGAGNYCDGQVRVTADLLGLNDDQPPFCQPIIQGKKLFRDKLKKWVDSERFN